MLYYIKKKIFIAVKRKGLIKMQYTREIDNDVLIQYIILFTLAEADRHVTYKQLSGLIFENCNIEFSNFQVALTNLEETGHIRSFSVDELTTVYELLPKGKTANEFFKSNIPVYIREPIANAIAPYFNEEEKKKSVRAELLPLNHREFAAECGIYDNNTPLLKMTVYAGTRESANKMLKYFKDNPEKIYGEVMEIMTKEDS